MAGSTEQSQDNVCKMCWYPQRVQNSMSRLILLSSGGQHHKGSGLIYIPRAPPGKSLYHPKQKPRKLKHTLDNPFKMMFPRPKGHKAPQTKQTRKRYVFFEEIYLNEGNKLSTLLITRFTQKFIKSNNNLRD